MKEIIKVENEIKIKNEIIDEVDRFVSFISEKVDSLNYREIWSYVIIEIVQHFLGPDDQIQNITIKAKNDKGEKYTLTIKVS